MVVDGVVVDDLDGGIDDEEGLEVGVGVGVGIGIGIGVDGVGIEEEEKKEEEEVGVDSVGEVGEREERSTF